MRYLIVLFLSVSCYSQNLTFEEFLSIRKMELAEVEEFLTKKEWEIISADGPDEETLGQLAFAYKKSYYNPKKAESFLYYNYDEEKFGNNKNRITIDITDVDVYNIYINKIKKLGCILLNSEVLSGEVVKVYRGATTTIKIRVLSPNYETQYVNHYLFYLYDNKEYDEITKQ